MTSRATSSASGRKGYCAPACSSSSSASSPRCWLNSNSATASRLSSGVGSGGAGGEGGAGGAGGTRGTAIVCDGMCDSRNTGRKRGAGCAGGGARSARSRQSRLRARRRPAAGARGGWGALRLRPAAASARGRAARGSPPPPGTRGDTPARRTAGSGDDRADAALRRTGGRRARAPPPAARRARPAPAPPSDRSAARCTRRLHPHVNTARAPAPATPRLRGLVNLKSISAARGVRTAARPRPGRHVRCTPDTASSPHQALQHKSCPNVDGNTSQRSLPK
ncbi:POU domain, class 3, transcription factor 3-like [Helicoverpa zea]|uniref:POU domain, class 3, transcription factor 3-like n=1 Tax=Helicoverpa zea TaxID=7113 RepID=UPI001F5A7E6C|nr:POU domain, class 3, transcription factor 3-like [Helicoverpa zea]